MDGEFKLFSKLLLHISAFCNITLILLRLFFLPPTSKTNRTMQTYLVFMFKLVNTCRYLVNPLVKIDADVRLGEEN